MKCWQKVLNQTRKYGTIMALLFSGENFSTRRRRSLTELTLHHVMHHPAPQDTEDGGVEQSGTTHLSTARLTSATPTTPSWRRSNSVKRPSGRSDSLYCMSVIALMDRMFSRHKHGSFEGSSTVLEIEIQPVTLGAGHRLP